MNACTDILLTVLKGPCIAEACNLLQISQPDLMPPSFPHLKDLSAEAKKAFINKLSNQVVDRLTIVEEAVILESVPESSDGVYDYARVFCHHASLALEFLDAWREGDGERVSSMEGVPYPLPQQPSYQVCMGGALSAISACKTSFITRPPTEMGEVCQHTRWPWKECTMRSPQ